VIVVVEGFDPSIASFHWESASEALCGEELVPIGFAVRFAFFQEEGTVSKQFTAISTFEALWVEFFADGIQAISL
jgi:hypothetical protein